MNNKLVFGLFLLMVVLIIGCTVPVIEVPVQDTDVIIKRPVDKEEYLLDQNLLLSAEQDNNLSLCALINNIGIKDLCFNNIAQETSNLEACDGVSEESAQLCKVGVAVSLDDEKLCDEFDTKESDYCFRDIGINNNESALCEEINFDDVRDVCYNKIALQTKNFTLCKKMDDPEDRLDCKYAVALKNRNITLCEDFKGNSSAVTRDMCIRSIAKLTNNILLCNNLKIGQLKEACFTYFAKKSR